MPSLLHDLISGKGRARSQVQNKNNIAWNTKTPFPQPGLRLEDPHFTPGHNLTPHQQGAFHHHSLEMVSRPPSWPLRGKSSRRFQLMSDLHLEAGNQYSTFDIPCRAPYLILAGDIGRLSDYNLYIDFLTKQCTRFRRVFLVLGNHEFYGGSRAEGLQLATGLEQETALHGRLTILNRTRIDTFDNLTILGCTLHSYISHEYRTVIENKVKDFTRIEKWTVADYNMEHKADVEWLRAQICDIRKTECEAGSKRRKIVVVTHHAPIKRGSSHPKDEKNPWSDAFGTNLIGVDNGTPLLDVERWIFGHTHYTTTCCINGVKLISNQRGYVRPSFPP